MIYLVFLLDSAFEDIKRWWAIVEDGDAFLVRAEYLIERLGESADEIGESRDGTARIVFHEGVAMYYEINAAELAVNITAVWCYR